MEHALGCMARLIRIILGDSAVSQRKLEYGLSLRVLGIEMEMDSAGYTCRLASDKKEKWKQMMPMAMGTGVMAPGVAHKLAGKLMRKRAMHGAVRWLGPPEVDSTGLGSAFSTASVGQC